MTALVLGLAVAVLLLAVLVAGLLRAHADVLRALHQMGVSLDPAKATEESRSSLSPVSLRPTPARPDSSDIADVTGITPRGDALSVAVGGVGHDTLLAFLTSGCATCRGFWEAFRQDTPDVPGGARLVVVTRGPEAESPGAIQGLSGDVQVVMSSDAWEHYDVPYAPYFVYVSGPAGKVAGEGVATGWEQARTLVANAVADGTTSPLPRRSRADRERDADVDQVLARAGIQPGDPRLHPASLHSPSTSNGGPRPGSGADR